VLPNGDVLLVASPGVFNSPSYVFEWDGSTFTEVPRTRDCAGNASYSEMLLVLPTGEILMTAFSTDVELYTPARGIAEAAIPVITAIRDADGTLAGAGDIELYPGRTYIVEGVRLNGVTQGAYYGDDQQSATNYPLVRVTYDANQHVRYLRTHDHSTMSIDPATEGSTHFDVPADAERGSAVLEVVANGVPSPGVRVDIK
jgi:hypothetical protein